MDGKRHKVTRGRDETETIEQPDERPYYSQTSPPENSLL
jgi:hypothetical protein